MEIKAIVVGLHHHNNGLVFDCGMPVSVVFDEENQHSDCAFKVFTEGGLMGGYLAESEFYFGKLANRLGAKLSFELKALVNQGYTIGNAVVEEIRGRALKYNKVVLKITLNEPETTPEPVIEEMEELPMDMGTISIVGTSHHQGEVVEGDLVHFKVVKGTTTLMTVDNVSVGVLPQGESKIAELTAINAPIVKNRDKREDIEFLNKPYTVVGIVEDKYVFVREMEEEDLVSSTTEEPKEVISPMEELPMCKVEKELDELNSSIRALKTQKEEIEAQMNELMAKREELAAINAKRNRIIEKIQNELETLDLSVLEAMEDCIPSSTPEEDTSSSIDKEDFVIDFKDHYEERISRFEQSNLQRESNTCDIVLYYASNTWGSERTIKDVKLSDNVVEYLKSVIPHNQCKGEKVIELEMALEAIL